MSGVLSMDPCYLCPRMCGAQREAGQKGLCGTAGELRIARAALHFWEEPPISGQSGSGTVFFGGCPLRCVYCQNAVIAKGDVGPVVDIERLARICLELQDKGALNVNFVTPTHYTPLIVEAVKIARREGLSLPVVWNTSGYERVSVIEALGDTVDVYLTDYKYYDARIARRYSHAPDYPQVALEAIDAMVKQVGEPRFERVVAGGRTQERMTRGVVVRHLVLPGALEQSKQAVRLLYERYGTTVLYSIMNQYTPVITGVAAQRYPVLCESVPSQEYEELLDYVDSLGLEDYFWQDSPADLQSFIPAWNGEGVCEE